MRGHHALNRLSLLVAGWHRLSQQSLTRGPFTGLSLEADRYRLSLQVGARDLLLGPPRSKPGAVPWPCTTRYGGCLKGAASGLRQRSSPPLPRIDRLVSS
jgi:hypothetical protein